MSRILEIGFRVAMFFVRIDELIRDVEYDFDDSWPDMENPISDPTPGSRNRIRTEPVRTASLPHHSLTYRRKVC